MLAVKQEGYTRINKAKARAMYAEGKTVYLQSCKYRPSNMWQSAMPISLEDANRYHLDKDDKQMSFDTRVGNFEQYNCQFNEQGYYAAYYMREDEAHA